MLKKKQAKLNAFYCSSELDKWFLMDSIYQKKIACSLKAFYEANASFVEFEDN